MCGIALRRALERGRSARLRSELTPVSIGSFSRRGVTEMSVVAISPVIVLLPISVLVRVAMLMTLGALLLYLNDVRRTRAARTYERDVVDAFSELTRALHSGSGLHEGLVIAAEGERSCSADIRRLLSAVRAGATLAESIDNWRHERRSVAVDTIGTALLLTLESGGSHARAVESASSVAQDVLEAQSVVSTHAAQALSSMWLLTALPIAVMVSVVSVDDAARRYMLHTTIGGGAILLGTLLDLVGVVVMTRMTRSWRAVA